MSALLSLQNVWVEYGEKIVLERINLERAAGSFVSIIGPSGAGKSSLLRIVLGQEAPTRGAIAATRPRVNAPATSRRSRVCCGGSDSRIE